MIGPQTTGTIKGVMISAQSHTGLRVTVNGCPAWLAIVTDDGQVIAIGDQVAKETEAVTLNNYRNFLAGKGHLTVYSRPITDG